MGASQKDLMGVGLQAEQAKLLGFPPSNGVGIAVDKLTLSSLLLTPPDGIAAANQIFGVDTPLGANTANVTLTAASSFSVNQSGSIRVYGNQSASIPGFASIQAGNVANAQARLIAPSDVGGRLSFQVGGGTSPLTRWEIDLNGDFLSNITNGGSVVFNGVGGGVKFKSGTNGRIGTATLVAGTVTIGNTSITANTKIFVSRITAGGATVGSSFAITRVNGTSFTITAINTSGTIVNTDTSVVDYVLFEAI